MRQIQLDILHWAGNAYLSQAAFFKPFLYLKNGLMKYIGILHDAVCYEGAF